MHHLEPDAQASVSQASVSQASVSKDVSSGVLDRQQRSSLPSRFRRQTAQWISLGFPLLVGRTRRALKL